MRKLLVIGFLLGYFTQILGYAYQSQNHPLLEQRRNKLLGIYGSFARAESDSKLSIEGFDTQNFDLSENQLGLGIQIGYLLSSNHRILLDLGHFFKKNGFSYDIFTLGYAFTPALPNTQSWRLLLGANAGITRANFDAGSFTVNDSSLGDLSYTGFTFGVKAGLLYELEFGELEFGVQARRLNFGEKSGTLDINGTPTNTQLDLSKTSNVGVYFGYNQLF